MPCISLYARSTFVMLESSFSGDERPCMLPFGLVLVVYTNDVLAECFGVRLLSYDLVSYLSPV
jgi:hypothetical protein